MITKELAGMRLWNSLIDFTGNSAFGSYLEALSWQNCIHRKTGVNSVILDSVEDADKAAANLASPLIYTADKCVPAPQNFYIPESGIQTSSGKVGRLMSLLEKLTAQINGLIDNPESYRLCWARFKTKTERTYSRGGIAPRKKFTESREFTNPCLRNTRVVTPLFEVDASKKKSSAKELFYRLVAYQNQKTPINLFVGKEMAQQHGAVSYAGHIQSMLTCAKRLLMKWRWRQRLCRSI